MEIQPVLIVHGGAGDIPDSRNTAKTMGVKKSVLVGYKILMETGNVLDAVEAAVNVMEDDEAFNCGYGSVLTITGEVEMDAIIIKGSNLQTGAVGAVKHVRYPTSLARKVMKSPHCLLVSSGAEEFANSEGMQLVETSELISPYARATLQKILENSAKPTTELGEHVQVGTVGAVAINSKGELAVATSTGGIAGKLPGRVGDTPIVGGGTFCDDNICGISATGLGEAIMRVGLSARIAHLIAEGGMDASEACGKALDYMTSKIREGDGGAIVITKEGKVGFNFNSKKMAWAYIQGNILHCGIQKGEDVTEECKI